MKLLVPVRERFLSKLVFNPYTGCVLWTGGRSAGGGRNIFYPSFWDGQRTVRGHVWAAENIHGIVREKGYHIDHQCRDTMCVQHLRLLEGNVNRSLGNMKRYEPIEPWWEGVPYHRPPDWCPKNIEYVMSPKEYYAIRRKRNG